MGGRFLLGNAHAPQRSVERVLADRLSVRQRGRKTSVLLVSSFCRSVSIFTASFESGFRCSRRIFMRLAGMDQIFFLRSKQSELFNLWRQDSANGFLPNVRGGANIIKIMKNNQLVGLKKSFITETAIWPRSEAANTPFSVFRCLIY